MAKLTDLTDLLGVINAVKGTEQTRKTSGGTTKKTSQSNVSDQGVTQLIDQILAGPGGVKSVGSAARSSGMFDSTVEDTQLAELYSSAANKAELARQASLKVKPLWAIKNIVNNFFLGVLVKIKMRVVFGITIRQLRQTLRAKVFRYVRPWAHV
jgi:hypothetical protein